MSKRRKYDGKNKISFIIIIVLSIVIIGIFSLFIYNYSKAAKIEYLIESGSVLQDVEKNYLNLDDDAKLKVRWDGNYYLIYNEKKISLGKKVIAYNTITDVLKMYGNFYEIASDGKIIENKNENVLNNTTIPKFYKLDDREYLLVDAKIHSNDNSIETGKYLLVELDKMGNAKLSNNSINLKTISPTVLVTSGYTFDIANEILNFGEFDIDLKKIIGSTNQYVPEGSGEDESGNEDDSNNNQDINNQVGSGNSNVQGSDDSEDDELANVPDVEDVVNKFKKSSIINIVEGIAQIDVDYVIYDPYDEYKAVYIELSSNEIGVHDRVYLSKNETRVSLGNLRPNTNYNLEFVTISNDSEDIDVQLNSVRTKALNYDMSIYKISNSENKLIYRIGLQEGFEISKVVVEISIENLAMDVPESCKSIPDEVIIDSNMLYNGYAIGDIPDISKCNVDPNSVFTLKVIDVWKGDNSFPINASFTDTY